MTMAAVALARDRTRRDIQRRKQRRRAMALVIAGSLFRQTWAHRSTGRGKDDHTNKPNRPIKEILCLPLTRRFRELLSQ